MISIEPKRHPIMGRITLPGSKSMTNRALMMAAAAKGISHLDSFLKCDDSYWCIQALRQLGVNIYEEGDSLTVIGRGEWVEPKKSLFVGSAGTTGRFLTSMLALSTTVSMCLGASEQLMKRPMKPLLDALMTLGATISYEGVMGCFPLTIRPRQQGCSSVTLSGAQSSQFISGLLMACPFLPHATEIIVENGIVQSDYVAMTIAMMKSFGISIKASLAMDRFTVLPGLYRPTDYSIEADASTASYFLALAAVTGGEICLSNLRYDTLQPDIQFLSILERMGCEVDVMSRGIILNGPAQLKGGFSVDMKTCSDVALTLAALAPFADKPIEIRGVEHIRKHESDRLSVMAEALR
ncbi:MAG TPA: 3-phosphoshikimate 1-carboxyvinyltransferase, partial [Chthoniobacterales bacterium]|nr:3-phosphoshikimate 1-carboxyvinyltransferase [Chthoniobacterales bacterium]